MAETTFDKIVDSLDYTPSMDASRYKGGEL